MRLLTTYLLLAMLLFLSVKAQTVPGVLECYSTSRGGGTHRLLVKGDFLYAAEGSSLVVYDMRTPSYPRAFDKRFNSPITDMVLRQGFLYTSANHDGIGKWDISIPIKPAVVAAYRPDDFFTGFLNMRFSGDTIFVAAHSAIWMLKEIGGIGPGFEKIGQFAEQLDGRGRTVSGEVMGGHYVAAIAGKDKGIGQGIHSYVIAPEARLNFQHYDAGEPEEVLRLPGTNHVVVFGGPSQGEESHLMVMDFGNPARPEIVWADTIRGAGKPPAVRAGLLSGDTLFVPITGRLGMTCDSVPGAIAIYRVQDTARLERWGVIPLPAAPRHVVRSGHRLHVAMGDAGIVTYDLGKWQPGGCAALPELGRSQRGGGYCLGADAAGDKLLTANGGAGAILHLIQDRKTIATRTFDRLGTVDQVRILPDGLHAACWVAARGGDSVVVIQIADGKPVGSLGGPLGHRLVKAWQSRIVCARDDRTGFDILDLRNVQKPKKEQTVLLNFNDLYLDDLGRLIVSTEHNIRVFDLSAGGFTELATMARWGEGYGAVAGDGQAFFAYSGKRGIIRYILAKDSKGFSLKEELVWKAPQKQPTQMAVDNHGIYLAYDDYGIFALDKQRFENQGYYRTGLDFRASAHEGLQDVFCADGKLFVVEYYGQVTLLKRVGVDE